MNEDQLSEWVAGLSPENRKIAQELIDKFIARGVYIKRILVLFNVQGGPVNLWALEVVPDLHAEVNGGKKNE